MSKNINLTSLFQTVTQDLVKNQLNLNQADGYNQNHGDNMVRTFQTITKAVQQKQKQGGSDSAALAYAARRLSKNTTSASAQLYAQGLSKAAAQFQGKQVDERSGLQLLQTLISGGQTPAATQQTGGGGDMLSALLGGMTGSNETQQQSGSAAGGDMLSALLGGMTGGGETQQQSGSAAGGDMLSALLGGMTGGGETQQQSGSAAGGDMLSTLLGGMTGGGSSGAGLQDGLDLGDLLNVGMAYMQFKQQGSSNIEALVKAFMQMSGMGRSADRTQSTELVVSSFLQALGAGR